jgi:hypothetical protein
MSKYSLYHDESKEAGYWHGMLLVPNESRRELVELLKRVRHNLDHQNPIGIKNVRNNRSKVFDCALSWLSIGCSALRSRTKGEAYPVYLGKRERGKKIYETLDSPIGCKLIVFREVSNHLSFQNYSDYGSKVETSFRIGLKGGLHFLGDEDSRIEISNLHFDGYKHYGRHIDSERIIKRMNGLRDYCSITDNICDLSSNHTIEESQPYDDCQLLQLTDLFVGSFRSCFHTTRECHKELTQMPEQLLKSYKDGYARMRNSRWRGSLSISQCSLNDDGWSFSSIEYKGKDNQLKLL